MATINTNMPASIAANSLTRNERSMTATMERLSTVYASIRPKMMRLVLRLLQECPLRYADWIKQFETQMMLSQ